jgi:hypothetical protein
MVVVFETMICYYIEEVETMIDTIVVATLVEVYRVFDEQTT